MTNPNGNNSDRLDRIEKLFEQNEIRLGRMILQQESDNRRMLAIERTIQAMLEQRATDKLEHDERMGAAEERMRLSEERINRLEDVAVKLANIEEAMQRGLGGFPHERLHQEAQNRMLGSIDEDRPTVLRRLMAIEKQRVAQSAARRLEASPRVDSLIQREREA